MFDLELHNFRSFRDPGPAQIKPLTVIVGENSTGKSSLLAILRIALDMVGGDLKPNFNRDPFFLGAYDQIAHYRGGRGGRRPSFSFTLRTNVKLTRRRDFPSSFPAAYSAEFVKSVSQPSVASIKMSCGDFEVDISEFNTSVPKIKLALPSWKGEVPQRIADVLPGPPHAYLGTHLFPFLFFHITRLIDEFENIRDPQATRNELEMLSRMWALAAQEFGPPPVAIAPVRTKPERTYNPIEETPTSEGSHVPMLMAKTYFTDRDKWNALQSLLNRFGKSAGLFEQVSLKMLGRSPSDPFQIMVKLAGPRSNLIDVGYGVSQVLPIVVDVLTSDSARNYLLQQPEVHLHPRGQAELATFLSSIVKETNNWIVIETHSDYIIDRLRSDIRKKRNLSVDQVSILFLERTGIETVIHQMGVDTQGNLVNAPATYREFTMEEKRRLLGIDEEDLAAAY